MPWTARIHMGGLRALVRNCDSCGAQCYDTAELPTRDRICLRCVAEELAKAEEEIDVDRERRFAGPAGRENLIQVVKG